MSGKRRAAGPAVKKTPKPRRTWKQRVLVATKWLLIATLVGFLLSAAGFYVAYRSIDIPNPNSAFQTQTTFVYYAGGKQEIGQFATQNRVSIPFSEMPQNVKAALQLVDGIGEVTVNMTFDPPWTPERMSEEAKLELNMF